MRKRYGFCFLALFFIPFAVSWAQDSTALTPTPIPVPVSTPAPASPSTPDSLEHSMNSRPSFEANIAESDLAQAILQNRPVFEEQEVRLILDDIEEFNRKIRTNLATIDQEIQKLRSQKQDWIRQKDVVQQLMRLDSLKDSRGKIYAETEKVLKNMNQVGIYLVVLDGVDPYASKEQLRALAKATLTPQAISELVGTFVQSSTEVRNNMLWKDLIRTVVSGRLEVEEDPVAWPMKKSGRFVYVARVKVHPQEKEGALDSLSTEGVQAKLIKAMPNPE
ncbi:MAG TPA: hypothetical protein VLM37_10565, partial [Fibrobacteraceae bacterium]|nr:hypothetical protein [Fibrobacteraceae bacterium]